MDQYVNYFSDTNICKDNYSIDYGLPVYVSADWSTGRDALADRSVMAYRPVHKQPTLGVLGGGDLVLNHDNIWMAICSNDNRGIVLSRNLWPRDRSIEIIQ